MPLPKIPLTNGFHDLRDFYTSTAAFDHGVIHFCVAATKEEEKACQENAEIVTDDEVDDFYEEEKAKLTPSTIPNE